MAKASQEEVNYKLGNPTRNCNLCEMFRRSGGGWDKCTDVEGDISPFGYCDIYAKRDDPELKQLAGAKPMRGYARGGRPEVGMPSIVGELGPEMFVPDVPGTIMPSPFQVAGNTPRYGPQGDVRTLSIRGINSLQRAIQNADSDEELLKIKKRLEKRGIDTGAIPGLDGL